MMLGILEKCVKFESINSKAPCLFPKVGKMLLKNCERFKHKNGDIDNVEITNEDCSCIECNKCSCSPYLDKGICSHILVGCFDFTLE
ncbi:hypothetical protein BpHYR1_012409 [Brachionus plicatilis]|uniref:SWIM-type domain-containing protein n=1 Tax=Brachionus plicatilis TaxID=10195 RepID=A0A3M7SHE8_BRAPC|nr:hypothetical protein BpHYR1_012409 [Brachionus plicatilis]